MVSFPKTGRDLLFMTGQQVRVKWTLLIHGEIMTQLLRKHWDANVLELASLALVTTELTKDVIVLGETINGFY